MRKISLIFLIAAFNMLYLQSMHAEIILPAIISSNMVLQRNTTIVLWGCADAKEKITINTSWLNESINIQANKEGSWRIEVKTTNSKEPQTIKITSKTSDINLDNIIFGEVWLCSGQSNMQQPLKGYQGQPTFVANMAIVTANNSNLRIFNVKKNSSKRPLVEIITNKG